MIQTFEIIWNRQKKLSRLYGMTKRNHGRQKLFRLRNTMDLPNADTAINQCHTTSKQMVNLRWFMLNVHVAELNDTFI